MKLVVIESPLSAPTREGIEENKNYAKACVRDSLARGEAPYASHLLYDQPGILNDLNGDERKKGMDAGFAWGAKAELIAVYIDKGISQGMNAGIERATDLHIPIEFRRLWPLVG